MVAARRDPPTRLKNLSGMGVPQRMPSKACDQGETQPPITTLHPAPSKVHRAWQSRMRRGRITAFESSLEIMQQWELEARLGRLIERALKARDSAEEAEMKALKARWDEAEALESIRRCRACLGLPDGPINQPGGLDDDA